MTKQEIIEYMYNNHVQGDFKIEEMAEDLAQPEIIRCKDCKFNYGVLHECEFNPHDIVCIYFETDGMDEGDYCSFAERKEE